MSTAEIERTTTSKKAPSHYAVSTLLEMLKREVRNHPLHDRLSLTSNETRFDEGTAMMLARLPNNALAIYVFREGKSDDPLYGEYNLGTFTVEGVLLMTVGCFFEGGDGFLVRNNGTKETLKFPEAHLPDAIAAACIMLRTIR